MKALMIEKILRHEEILSDEELENTEFKSHIPACNKFYLYVCLDSKE